MPKPDFTKLNNDDSIALAKRLIVETLTEKGSATLKGLTMAHGASSGPYVQHGGLNRDNLPLSRVFDRALQSLRKDERVVYANKAWSLVSRAPSQRLIDFVKTATGYLLIAVDEDRIDIDALARETGLPVARSESEYRTFAYTLYDKGATPARFLISESVLYGCQNFEQAYDRTYFRAYHDRRLYA